MTIPTNLRVPFVAVEINNQNAQNGPQQLPYRGLLIGQKLSGGSGTANALYLVTSVAQVIGLAGRGSMLHRMAIAWFAVNNQTPVYIAILADAGGGAQAVGNVTMVGTATAPGTLSLYIGGSRVALAVSTGDTAATIATNLAALLPTGTDLPATGAVDGMVTTQVNITYRHKGAVGNQLDLRFNYQDGDAFPAGVTASVSAVMATGTTNPTLTTLIAALGDQWFQIWANPYIDSTSLAALEAELASRFGPMRMIDGYMFSADNDTYGNVTTLGEGRNSPHSSIFPTQGSPTQPCEIAAQVAGAVAIEGAADPALPLQTVPLPTVLPPAPSDQYTLQERNNLLYSGIATWKVGPGGLAQLERVISTYQTNSAAAPDSSYLDATTLLTLMYLRYSFRTELVDTYPRAKLAADGTRFGPGQSVVTPGIAKSFACIWFRQMEALGLVQNFTAFKSAVSAVIDISDPNKLDILLPPQLIGQFIVGATELQFIL